MALSPSPLLNSPGAAPAPEESGENDAVNRLRECDSAVAWHYGDPLREQRDAVQKVAVVDRSHRFVIAMAGEERLSWLHTISSQHITDLPDGGSAENLSLDVNGRVEHHFVLTDLAGTTWIDTEAATGPALLDFLKKMVFWAKAEPRDGNELAVLTVLGPDAANVLDELPTTDYAALPLPGGGFVRRMPSLGTPTFDLLIPREQLTEVWQRLTDRGATRAGLWAYEALRVAALSPRAGIDTDDRTIPHEVGWIGAAVHLDKGCYRGQETVARVHNLGKSPRRKVLLHLDGSAEGRPAPGDPVTADGRAVGRVGTVIDHFEYGPIALALVKRNVPVETTLVAGPSAASIDPDSVAEDNEPQAGRLAVERLRGR
ncbi:YgfZ/GcvT domain-containing protein [Aldersonia kunmingensis]|uniref:CAF17-like 4Fe-4S cluster assembly/insertion protein YgfZ n=1 Tax=Aldersonia kunmingensis TaxID=408066 RepID=UPI000835BE79|nr:folate-binding protein YgfZ [Aldersonia kunmingensis]